VQGVGFRPFVHRLATELDLTGWVRNDETGVLVEVQGQQVNSFVERLKKDAPQLANIRFVSVEQCSIVPGESDFEIAPSRRSETPATQVAARLGPDVAPCPACLAEVVNPSQRRYLYPFSSCTDCGPRLTIARGLPYDRALTTLAEFSLCEACSVEYHDPANRRFHAQPLACEACGPHLSHSLAHIVATLRNGGIVALKGVGGYQLLCDARRESVVARLRQRKRREGKPFAVLVQNAASARLFGEWTLAELTLLEDFRRPIVLVRRKEGCPIAPSVSGGRSLSTVGLVLPMSLLHVLLFFEWFGRPQNPAWYEQPSDVAFVATSGNVYGEPLIADDAEAQAKLGDVADLVVSHNRPIATRCDDSVVKTIGERRLIVRRARGFVPEPVELPCEMPPVLGLGGDGKAAFCLTRGREAFLSQHLGDLDNLSTLDGYREAFSHLSALLGIRPEKAVCDLHPDFVSRRIAKELGLPLVEVQHHHAHLLAVLGEHKARGPAVGLVVDGFGYGQDKTAWGGEVLFSDGQSMRRLGQLSPISQPGGELCARQPWRLATAVLTKIGQKEAAERRFGKRWPVGRLLHLLETTQFATPTTACGRYFQAASALLGLCDEEHFEAEAALLLEGQVLTPSALPGGFRLSHTHDRDELDFAPLWLALLDCDVKTGAELFHGTLAMGLVELAMSSLKRLGHNRIALGGGCVQNGILANMLCAEFSRRGIEVFLPQHIPPNDGGLSFGQVVFESAAHAG
jgi:hydrogenase maturation protein HypF